MSQEERNDISGETARPGHDIAQPVEQNTYLTKQRRSNNTHNLKKKIIEIGYETQADCGQ